MPTSRTESTERLRTAMCMFSCALHDCCPCESLRDGSSTGKLTLPSAKLYIATLSSPVRGYPRGLQSLSKWQLVRFTASKRVFALQFHDYMRAKMSAKGVCCRPRTSGSEVLTLTSLCYHSSTLWASSPFSLSFESHQHSPPSGASAVVLGGPERPLAVRYGVKQSPSSGCSVDLLYLSSRGLYLCQAE